MTTLRVKKDSFFSNLLAYEKNLKENHEFNKLDRILNYTITSEVEYETPQ